MNCTHHTFLQDVQTEIPSHLLHLKVELEKSRLMASVQECQAELARENRSLPSMGSERLIKEHRVRATSITPLYKHSFCPWKSGTLMLDIFT